MSFIPCFGKSHSLKKKNHQVLFSNFTKLRRIESSMDYLIRRTLIQNID